MPRTYDEIMQDARDIIRALRKAGMNKERIMRSIRLFVTEEELDIINRYRESRSTVASGTGHIAYAGAKVGFFGIPITTEQGESTVNVF